ncbi:hypothetical protein B0A75_03095 [Flavobacterium oncorhynchi]|uniref:Uncharacterized protein n=1 Tax=Flavobacterium oncorhynchi TaxID=728056 RepID=A0A226IAP1_9FLAO|nr:hypothetical protein B0A75_03095 [Flavobacterium oncorhynchi]
MFPSLKFAAQVPKPITKPIMANSIIFNEVFLSREIKIRRRIPARKAITLIKAAIPPIATKGLFITDSLIYFLKVKYFFSSKIRVIDDFIKNDIVNFAQKNTEFNSA